MQRLIRRSKTKQQHRRVLTKAEMRLFRRRFVLCVICGGSFVNVFRFRLVTFAKKKKNEKKRKENHQSEANVTSHTRYNCDGTGAKKTSHAVLHCPTVAVIVYGVFNRI